MGTTSTRRFKMAWLFGNIETANKAGFVVDKEKLIAEFCLHFSSGRRTCLEILNQLVATNRILIRGGEIWTPKTWEAEQILKAADALDTKEKEVQKE